MSYPWLVGPPAATLVLIVGAGAEMGLAGPEARSGRCGALRGIVL